jgi:ferredoxin
MITVDKSKCPKDHKCPMIKACPQQAISQKGFDAPAVDKDKCIECNYCVQHCPYSAFEVA